MGSVIVLSGPIGAGKTTVARELVKLLPSPLSYIEGDTFWSFVTKTVKSQREDFYVIMRSMTAAAIPFARAGYDVLLDFSIPPAALPTARKILKELALDFVVLCPTLETCQARAANRTLGKIQDYFAYNDFYALFDAAGRFKISDDNASPADLAAQIQRGLAAGKFRVSDTDIAAHQPQK